MSPEPTPPPASRRPWLAPLGLAALMGGLFFLRLGQDLPLRTHEALLAETARNMFLNHPARVEAGPPASPWLVPNFNDEPRLRKTPLPYWMVAGLACLTGRVDEWTARLPSALAALGTVLLLVALVRRWTDRQTAVFAGAVLTTSAGFLIMARTAQADMPMTFFTTASLAAAWMAVESVGRRRFLWLLLAGTAAGLSMMAKGPAPALVLAVPYVAAAAIMAARLVRARRSGQVVRGEWAWTCAGAAAGAAVALAIMLPWPVAVWLHVPDAWRIWKAESLDRSTGDYGHQEPVYFYVTRLPALVAPWTVFFIGGLVLAARRLRADATQRPWLLFVGAWLVGTLAAFSVMAGKQDHYILPLAPAAAVCTAVAMRHLFASACASAERAGRWLLIGHGAAVILAGAAGIAAYAVFLAAPEFLIDHKVPEALVRLEVFWPAAILGGMGIVGGLTACVLAIRRRPAGAMAALTATLAATFLYAWPTLLGPLDRAAAAADFGRNVRQVVPPGMALYGFPAANHTVIFYLQRPVPPVPFAAGADVPPDAVILASNPDRSKVFYVRRPAFVMCDAADRKRLESVSGLRLLAQQRHRYRPDEGFWLFQSLGKP